ncbi:MAG: cobalamin-dependent protein [Deltaproteobacteria bacterium]|nr:cobalamin-dependent protein [Deltaproteobacteria bacterium]MBW1923173.1 cobalamin-dependent protein [Deltaproteobacteria bacterium]MBW1949294.1 cobalamin-dependent protein [Deltaproteobacteria bacterium]MBW2009823.1 cobalamin-dependent protein [Deltaproteobacteria bacterium]
MPDERKMRVLLSRDDWYHQRGYWVIASALKDAGFEVVLGGIQTPVDIVQTALEEDVDVVGYRIMDGAPKVLLPILFEEMEKRGGRDIPVVVGGIVPEKEETVLRELGVRDVFHPYSPLQEITERIRRIAMERRRSRSDSEDEKP